MTSYLPSTPVACQDCSWAGTLLDVFMKTKADRDDIDHVAVCPCCGSENWDIIPKIYKSLLVNRIDLLNKCNSLFSEEDQIDKAVEECIELASALLHLKNNGRGSGRYKDVLLEIVDVKNMIDQIIVLLGIQAIEYNKAFDGKLEKVKQAIIRKSLLQSSI